MNDRAARETTTPLFIQSVDDDAFRQAVLAGATVYALIDACDEPQVPALASIAGRSRAVSLYRAQAERNYASFAPYLFAVDPSVLSWIQHNLYGKPWGYFFVTDGAADFATLRKHWRKFLQVTADDGRSLYFRFYDPRIIEPFLKACTDAERQSFMGPSQSLILERDGQLQSIMITPGGSPDHATEPLPSESSLPMAMQPRHMRALIADKRQRIESELCELLRSEYGDDLRRQSIQEQQLPQLVHAAVDRAKGYAIVGRQDVELYLICMVRLGLDFDTNLRLSWPHEILNRSDLTGSAKMDLFYARLFEQPVPETA